MRTINIYKPELQNCVVCGRFLVRKYTTQPRTVVGLHETIIASEHVMKCNNKNCSNRGNPIRSAELQSIVLSHMTYGIDIIAHAGELRFYDHLTFDEIIEKFSKKGLKFDLGEISFIINKFLALLAGVQEEKIPEIRSNLEKKGFVLSIDGTISVKGKTLYIFRDTVSGTVLFSEICELNDTKQMESLFRRILEKFGFPMAIISDMQQSIIEAVKTVFPGIPHQYCQSHFLRNVGNALTKELHQELGKEIKKAGIQTEVNNIQREMNKKKDEKAKLISDLCLSLKVTTDQPPFDLYYVDLVDRYRIVRTAIRKCISLMNEEDEYKNALIKLDDKLNIVLRDDNIKVHVEQLKYYHRYFKRLCDIFDEKRNGKEIKEHVEKRVARYRTEIIRLSRNHPKFKKVIFQLDKYWDGLFHTYEYGYIPRTNNDMEKKIWNFQKIWKRITGYNNLNNWINIHGCFSIFLLNFKPEDGKICHQTMGIKNESFATLIGSVSIEIRMKNFEKQKTLREEHKTRISIKAKGIKAFLKDKVDKIKDILKINSD